MEWKEALWARYATAAPRPRTQFELQYSYNVVPTNSWQNADGRYCREYSATARIGGELRKTYGTACRQADGSWQIVS